VARRRQELVDALGLAVQRYQRSTQAFDRLVAKGLIERVPDDIDRRQVLVQMTEEGHARTWELYGPLAMEGRQQLARLRISDLELMLRQLESMRELTDKHRANLGG
jgi:DNA-binding MarR family transcriptional regulator